MNDLQRWRIVVRGRVQGVGYRRFCERAAVALGLAGWVGNEADGSVVAEAEGPLPRLQELQQQLQRGPLFARVASVDLHAVAPTGEPGFLVRR